MLVSQVSCLVRSTVNFWSLVAARAVLSAKTRPRLGNSNRTWRWFGCLTSHSLLKNCSRTNNSTRWSWGCPTCRLKISYPCSNQSGGTASLTNKEESLRLWLRRTAKITSKVLSRLRSTKMNSELRFTTFSSASKIRLWSPQASCDSYRLTGSIGENKFHLWSSCTPKWRARRATSWLNSSGSTYLKSGSYPSCWWAGLMKTVLSIKARFLK